MDKDIRKLIDSAKKRSLAAAAPDKQTILSLLEIGQGTEEMGYLLDAAEEVAQIVTSKKAYLWGAIGINYAKCSMNCGFCSFGEKWGIVQDEFSLSEEEILEEAAEYVNAGVYYIVLRTTEFYDLEKLSRIAERIREEVSGTYELILNVGEFDLQMANRLYRCGVDGIYHAIRLREGIDTGFEPDDRRKTLEAIKKSPLKLIHLVEPLGPEHTNEEIADRFLESIQYGVFISGVMVRVPVKGTPLGESEKLDAQRAAHIVAVLRLTGGYTIPNICIHPMSAQAVKAGANVVVTERGAIPRDAKPSKQAWHKVTPQLGRQLLEQEGYQVYPEVPKGPGSEREACGEECTGANLDRFVQPAILSLLLDECLTAYQIHGRLTDYSMYRDRPPDMAGVYRYTKSLKDRGLLEQKQSSKNRTMYSITPEGRRFLRSWISTLESYRDSIGLLLKEMGGF
ncbi:MAG: radical SAM protein [Firmicutes bacterium]|nr:radical SAM protein [Bacillota bacterium]